ncbi:hypothetical protein [uncultured Arcticibacterium sp.]|uniref:hypothetical protein n=1 Tax=uncultured Arcticibacterium sp. TaxID=2173042 RepID=UPI0030F9FDA0
MKLLKCIVVIFISFACNTSKAQLTVTGTDWVPSIDASSVTEAGIDYASDFSIESLVNQSEMDVTPILSALLPPLFNWTVQASMTSVVNWHPNLELALRRSGDGTGSSLSTGLGLGLTIISPRINGGENYQSLTVVPTTFFTGRARYQDIPIQYKISGLSVLIPTKTYSTDVLYTFIGL